MTHVFISFAKEDSELADLLESDLSEQGHPAWRDMSRHEDNDSKNNNLELALDDAYGMVVLVSSNTLASEVVENEVKFAQSQNTPTIVLQLDNAEIPPTLKKAQVIHFSMKSDIPSIEQIRLYRDTLENLVGMLDKIRPTTLYLEQLQDSKDTVRENAARALGDLGDPSATEPLIQALLDPDEDVRMFAAEALGKLRSEAALKPLIRMLSDEDADVCAAAATALGQIGRSAAVGPIMEQLNHLDRFVRAAAARALGELNSIDAVRPLTHMMRNDSISDVRAAATDALCSIRAITESLEADRALKRARVDWTTHTKNK